MLIMPYLRTKNYVSRAGCGLELKLTILKKRKITIYCQRNRPRDAMPVDVGDDYA
jgi:hypothetical protein